MNEDRLVAFELPSKDYVGAITRRQDYVLLTPTELHVTTKTNSHEYKLNITIDARKAVRPQTTPTSASHHGIPLPIALFSKRPALN